VTIGQQAANVEAVVYPEAQKELIKEAPKNNTRKNRGGVERAWLLGLVTINIKYIV